MLACAADDCHSGIDRCETQPNGYLIMGAVIVAGPEGLPRQVEGVMALYICCDNCGNDSDFPALGALARYEGMWN